LKTVLKFVGDRYNLNKSQRNLLSKAVFSDKETKGREGKLVNIKEIRDCTLGIDGYNVLVTLESALQGKPIILADDGLIRDIAGKSGRYKPGERTLQALELIIGTLREYPPREVVVLFDEKMSKSLQLAKGMTGMMNQNGLTGGAKKVFDLAGYVIREKLRVQLIHCI